MSVPRPGHVGGDGDLLRAARLHDDLASRACCLAFSTLCGHPLLREHREMSSEFSTDVVPEQLRLALGGALLHVVDDRLVLLLRRDEDLVVQVLADHLAVRRDEHRLRL
jgi:hypothetical protein